MQIYVHRDGQQLGPFSESEIKEQVALESISGQDLVWWEGQPGWVRLDQSSLRNPPTPTPAPAMVTDASAPQPPPIFSPITGAERTSGLAIGALVSGIVTFFLAITFIVPIVLGHMGLAQIRRNPGMKGRGMAIAGLILGYSVPVILVFIAVVAISFLMAVHKDVKSTLTTIDAQIQAQRSSGTDSDQNPSSTTNNAPDSATNAAPQPSGQ